MDFFRFKKDSLEELRKLVALIEGDKIKLLTTSHLKDEYLRNRDGVIEAALREMNKSRAYSFPVAVREFEEYELAVTARDEFEEQYSKLINKFKERAESMALGADKLNSKLLSLSNEIAADDEIFNRAIKRWRLGNPPGKGKNSIGDEANWECLLKHFDGSWDDLHLVSGDGDYASELDSKKLKPILQRDWEKSSILSSIHLYGSLSEFFKKHFPDIKLASEVELHLCVEKLASSGSFAATHEIVAELLTFSEMTPSAAKRIVDIAQTNNQVGWIATDQDLFFLFKEILRHFGTTIGKERREYLEKTISEGAEIWEQSEPGDDEAIPF